ncbi:MAG TPA: putative cytokinetic ring protein SteA [Mycobacteriales bacterium]|nr:putative cytokinetic ring protein SteA [Mycobacteriales bacterium]
MKLALPHRARQSPPLPGVSGPARVDRRTDVLARRLQPGDIAVIDHVDLDRVSAAALLAGRAAAVVNVSASTSGRYPNLGPTVLAGAGIPLVDGVGPQILGRIREGEPIRVCGDTVYAADGAVLASGAEQSTRTVAAAAQHASAGLGRQLEAVLGDASESLRRSSDLFLDGAGIPRVRTEFDGRHALVVGRGYQERADLAALRGYIREFRPVLVGVDGGADALREAGYRPDVIVGDLDAVRDETLRCGAELVVHADPGGQVPSLQWVQDLGLEARVCPTAGTNEDAAILLADANGASLIVTAGRQSTLEESLDRGRSGMASSLLTRLRVGGKLVSASAVAQLYRPRISLALLAALVLAAVLVVGLAAMVSPSPHLLGATIVRDWAQVVRWVRGNL